MPTLAWGDRGKRAILLDAGEGNYIEIFERADQPPFARPADGTDREPTLLHVAMRVDDVDAVLEKVREAGMAVRMEPKDVTLDNTLPNATAARVPIRIAFFYGPDDEVVELFQNDLT